ncbi:hypothetical protein MJO28_005547 [Puccinia striiformis f. sp. tritici]|uniref:Uncharacterized protein n=1 Tax=Puccinia striiformis f. sp. tritici TaxID=168172 RepID=A0ACC0EMR2_9BASI|nr:hypothetical protein MJO28_005547 [Puccinia striiformis f. sp. tritici]
MNRLQPPTTPTILRLTPSSRRLYSPSQQLLTQLPSSTASPRPLLQTTPSTNTNNEVMPTVPISPAIIHHSQQLEIGPPSTPTPHDGIDESPKDSTAKKRALRSDVWDHYGKVKINGQAKARCHYCPAILSAGSNSGTTHLRRHTVTCQQVNGVNSTCPKGSRAWVFSQHRSQEEFSKMVVEHEYCFAMAGHQRFIKFMGTTQPGFVVPSRKTLRNDCWDPVYYNKPCVPCHEGNRKRTS